jgi:organic radical activating enzyme
MVNDFCFLLSNGLFISDKGHSKENINFSPCCIYDEQSSDITSAWQNIKDWTKNCDKCFLKEKHNKKSRRQEMNQQFSHIKNAELSYLEIDHNNACNAACGMCNSMASSSIAQILRKEGNNYVDVPTIKQKEFFNVIDKLDLSKVKVIKFRGGEPFYSNFHQKVLEKVEFPSNTTLMYQTNGSIYPKKEWWNIANKFKEIHMSFSIDGVNERFNYIRSNLIFTAVKKNIIKILENKQVNFTVSIECTINPLNAYYFDEIFKFMQELKKYNKNITFNWHQCWGDWGLENTPLKLRELITNKYKNINLCKVINDFELDDSKFVSFVLSLQKHEKRFNLDTMKTFPEVYPLILEYYESLVS